MKIVRLAELRYFLLVDQAAAHQQNHVLTIQGLGCIELRTR